MKTTVTAIALAAALTQPAAAITFPSLTTIYVGAGVVNQGTANAGVAAVFQCSNVSGSSAQVRIVVHTSNGFAAGENTITIPHAGAGTLSTHFTNHFVENGTITDGISFDNGTVNIESTQSGVFCQGFRVDGASASPLGVPLHLVRVNPHPGTVE